MPQTRGVSQHLIGFIPALNTLRNVERKHRRKNNNMLSFSLDDFQVAIKVQGKKQQQLTNNIMLFLPLPESKQ